jgi:uncharacterized membrane protein (DUF106 family)
MALFIHLYIVNFFRTLVIIAIIYFAIRLISRYLLPFLLENKMKEMQQKMHEQEEQKRRAGKREGEVTIEYDQKKNTIRNHNEGEYVDFEEVD